MKTNTLDILKQTNTLDILKQAILLEKRGKSFYQTVAEKTESEAVKVFFEMMADEEGSHIKILSEQFKSFKNTGQSAPYQAGGQAQPGGGVQGIDPEYQKPDFCGRIRVRCHFCGYEYGTKINRLVCSAC
ncbi:MAG: ferritin family protein [candidate division KSB1 bacterium]|nr:ferritin family protein [candidate division KSB1 bacterium]